MLTLVLAVMVRMDLEYDEEPRARLERPTPAIPMNRSTFSPGQPPGTARFAVQTNAKSAAISEQSVDAFFDELMDDPQSDRFRGLRDLLTANLEGLCVFRVDRGTELDVYVIGSASAGEWVGVKTISVET